MCELFVNLGGNAVKHERFAMSREEGRDHQEENQRNNGLATLADESLEWIELVEGLGRPPELSDFGVRKFTYHAELIETDVDTAWPNYTNAIERALADTDTLPAAVDGGDVAVSEPDDGHAPTGRSEAREVAAGPSHRHRRAATGRWHSTAVRKWRRERPRPAPLVPAPPSWPMTGWFRPATSATRDRPSVLRAPLSTIGRVRHRQLHQPPS